MNLFPDSYERPVLIGIVTAAGRGWNAECSSGGSPSSGSEVCSNGGDPNTAPLCPGMGGGANSNRLFNNNGGSSSGRLINPADVGSGI